MLAILAVISDGERDNLNSLLELLKEGNADALGRIYSAAGGRLFCVAFGIVKDRPKAEDVLHDSFIKVVRFCQKYKSGTNAYAWLCTVVRNTALNKIKSDNLKRETDIDSFYNLSDGHDLGDERDKVIAVEAAVKTLEPRERTVIWLKYYNDMTVRTIADETGLPRSTVQGIIKTAEEKLKKLLK